METNKWLKKSLIHKMLQIIRSVQNKAFLKTENININISKTILRVSLSKTRKNIYSKKIFIKRNLDFAKKNSDHYVAKSFENLWQKLNFLFKKLKFTKLFPKSSSSAKYKDNYKRKRWIRFSLTFLETVLLVSFLTIYRCRSRKWENCVICLYESQTKQKKNFSQI